MTRPPGALSVAEVLARAREGLVRVDAVQAAQEQADGALLVDIRPVVQRLAEGEVPGALVCERNHLEWRLDPQSDARLPVASYDRAVVVVCAEGWTSSLAAAALQELGLDATDLVGGVAAWKAAGLPVVPGGTESGSYSPAAAEAAGSTTPGPSSP